MKAFLSWLFPRSSVRYATPLARHLHDAAVFLLVFAVTLAVSFPLSSLTTGNSNFPMPLFILAVAVIARFTEGYLYGIAASVLAVWFVNYIFTYPYWAFNMTLIGYPLIFSSMLLVSVIISALTTQNKRQAQAHMEAEMEKTRANLLRSVSHDLRTPLTAIIGSSSVLMSSPSMIDSERELAASIHEDARWLARITENILAITKVSGDRVQLKKEPEVVEEIVGSAIGKFRQQHPEIRVTVRKPEDILLAPMDATLIEQVLLNLMDNAVIHGKITTAITIILRQSSRVVSLTVADNGAGIPPALRPHLFDGSSVSGEIHPDAKRNMGIGLSVCKSIITAHGGAMIADHTEQGASITFTLPITEE